MYHFAIVALLALAAVKLVDFLIDLVPGADGFRSVLRSLFSFVVAIGGVWILDYSFFDGFGVTIRNRAVGVWGTGLIVAGLTVPWRAVFAFLTSNRATADETLGEHVPMRPRKVA